MVKTPNILGLTKLRDIPIQQIIPYIHWSYLFMAWRVPGKYTGIEKAVLSQKEAENWLDNIPQTNREKSQEALKLYKDSVDILQEFQEKNVLQIHANIGLYPAFSKENDIFIKHENDVIVIPTLRQQKPTAEGYCFALSDYILPEEKLGAKYSKDYIGVFANTVLGVEAYAETYEKEGDIYKALLAKILAERLAEGTAEWLHYQIRKQYWGYAPDEEEHIDEMFKVHYQGIRPAVGYPSLPDQSVIFELDPLIQFNEMGIQLTEHGAMSPNASVCGLVLAHPQSNYFVIGKIDEQQLADYARRRNKTVEEMSKWLSSNL